MSWLTWFALAVIVTGFAAVTGIKARGTRHVARTQLMGMARIALWALVVIFVCLAIRAHGAA